MSAVWSGPSAAMRNENEAGLSEMIFSLFEMPKRSRERDTDSARPAGKAAVAVKSRSSEKRRSPWKNQR